MIKPIFIVRFPKNSEPERLSYAAESLRRMGLGDEYHILVIKDELTGDEIKFECYNSPHTEMEFDELQERVMTLLNTQKE